jgi:hypothetical protein
VTVPTPQLRAFTRADLDGWLGLPELLDLTELTGLLDFDPDQLRLGATGEPSRERTWVAAASQTYAGGLKVWLEGGEVIALEGVDPVDAAGDPLRAPALGAPDTELITALGPIGLFGTEAVHAGRGLAVRVYPATGVLVGVIGFVPTTVDDYCARIRPRHVSDRPMLAGELS